MPLSWRREAACVNYFPPFALRSWRCLKRYAIEWRLRTVLQACLSEWLRRAKYRRYKELRQAAAEKHWWEEGWGRGILKFGGGILKA